jgi:hypothetical protein
MILAVILASAALAASPDPDVAKAKQTFDAAQRLYKQARYADALAKFEEAYRFKPHPVIIYNIGKCYERLGEISKALRQYHEYLRMMPDAKDKEQVTDAIANLERRLKDKGVQQLIVYSDPDGALVSVDDQELGTAPASAELPPGSHHVKIAKEGYEPAERSFVMPFNRSVELSFALKAAQPKPPETPPVPAPPPPPSAMPEETGSANAAIATAPTPTPEFLPWRLSLRGDLDVLNRTWSPSIAVSYAVAERLDVSLDVVVVPASSQFSIGFRPGAYLGILHDHDLLFRPYAGAGLSVFVNGAGADMGGWVAVGVEVRPLKMFSVSFEVPLEYYWLRPTALPSLYLLLAAALNVLF